MLARGLGRSYGDAAQNAGGDVVDLSGGAAGILELDPVGGTVTVDAGISLDRLLRTVVPVGWFVAVTPGTRFVTVGGAIASDVHGKNHHLDGGFVDHVRSFELVTPASGRITVTPEDPAFRATAGGMGLTGIVTEATLRLLPIATSMVAVDTERFDRLDELMAAMDEGDHRYRYSVAWVDCMSRGRRLGRGVLTRGYHAPLDRLSPSGRRDPLRFEPSTRLRVPLTLPSGLLSAPVAAAFNKAWFRHSPRLERDALHNLSSFFHPLDGVAGWNRLYGPRGFVQYQFVVPFERHDVVHRTLQRLAAAGCPSFLAVLKRFGPGGGLLSFPVPGWTLALDIPAARPGLGRLLDGLDELVAEAGGRVYLAKDSRLRPDLLPVMYPELQKWRAIRSMLDPKHVLRSDLDRRLGLSGS